MPEPRPLHHLRQIKTKYPLIWEQVADFRARKGGAQESLRTIGNASGRRDARLAESAYPASALAHLPNGRKTDEDKAPLVVADARGCRKHGGLAGRREAGKIKR